MFVEHNISTASVGCNAKAIRELANWRIGELAKWTTEKLANWRIRDLERYRITECRATDCRFAARLFSIHQFANSPISDSHFVTSMSTSPLRRSTVTSTSCG